jgi:hypothetical protein
MHPPGAANPGIRDAFQKEKAMNSQELGTVLTEELLAQVHGGMNQPKTIPDYRVEPKALGGVMAAGAVTGGLGGAAIGASGRGLALPVAR